ncbi:MAG: flagellar basal body P-ring formation chaperone FlgA [Pseudomonadota bacterium]
MIRLLTLALTFLMISGFAPAPLEMRVLDALRISSVLPADADIRLVTMTQVRGAVETIEISSFDPHTGRFTAIIGHGSNRKGISGRASVTVPVVVTRAGVRRDHTLTASDLEVRHVPYSQVPATAFAAVADLEGYAVRRSMPAGRPIRDEDVGAPRVLNKNDSVEIVYRSGGLELSVRGRALEDGGRGDVIRVAAQGGGDIVSAEITGPGVVVVR